MEKDQTPREDDRAVEPDRDAARADVDKRDAPTAVEENEGMSTVLSADTADGVQKNANEE
jgi:hypothetical protein